MQDCNGDSNNDARWYQFLGHFMELLFRDKAKSFTVVEPEIIRKTRYLGLHTEPLGEISAASSISCLDSGLVYVGSSSGGSQLVELHQRTDAIAACITIVKTYANLCRYVGMEGRCRVVTCSGAQKDSSLRLVRDQIEVKELASYRGLGDIVGMWSYVTIDPYDTVLVVSCYIGQHKFLK
ncbi:hypothetical protein FF1_027560 [Malus domestica]